MCSRICIMKTDLYGSYNSRCTEQTWYILAFVCWLVVWYVFTGAELIFTSKCMKYVSMIMFTNLPHIQRFLWHYNIVNGKSPSSFFIRCKFNIPVQVFTAQCFKCIYPRMQTHTQIRSICQVLIKNKNKIQNNYRHLCKNNNKILPVANAS